MESNHMKTQTQNRIIMRQASCSGITQSNVEDKCILEQQKYNTVIRSKVQPEQKVYVNFAGDGGGEERWH